MPYSGSISKWIPALREGDERAIEALWSRFAPRLISLARARLRRLGTNLARTDEDFALSAFNHLCRNVTDGKYPDLEDRDGLWRVLAVMTRRKISDGVKYQSAEKRGGTEFGEVEIPDDLACERPTPDQASELTDEFEKLLSLLADPKLEKVVLLKLEGYTNEEIADELQASSRTIQRMMQLVRRIWERHLGE